MKLIVVIPHVSKCDNERMKMLGWENEDVRLEELST